MLRTKCLVPSLRHAYNNYYYFSTTTFLNSKSYKDTLNLPNYTALDVYKISKQTEQELQTRNCTIAYEEQSPSDKKFILHDGPPYANGSLHMGHALNKTLKDIVNRFKLLQDFQVEYIPGWDCHGLPIELKALEKQKLNNNSPMDIRTRAKQFALDTIEKQKQNFMQWGIMGDWNHYYSTMTPEFEANQLLVFKTMVQKGYIFRGERPVYWSPSSKTALAEAELEYPDQHTSIAIHVSFPMVNDPNTSVVIWTTTPWTLVANEAVCYHEQLIYVKCQHVQKQNQCIILSKECFEKELELWKEYTIVEQGNGKHFFTNSTNLYHPFLTNKIVPLLHGNHVTEGMGTGLVHTAPGHGMDDFIIGKQHHLPITCPVDDHGKYNSQIAIKEWIGLNVLDQGNEKVIELLQQTNHLLACNRNYHHKYPYDWRTKKPVIIRTTRQWFANLESLKEMALQELDTCVTMIPNVGRNRLVAMLSKRNEWCISRQRVWGVPIPVFYYFDNNNDKEQVLCTEESMSHVMELIRQYGSDCWFTMDVQQLLHPMYRDNGITYRKGMDTLDVWFDSGTTWMSVMKNDKIADLYLEGSDQHRGWFQSSLLTSIAHRNHSPYKQVVTHGFVLDEQGKKMSKSLGNIIEPNAIIEKNNYRVDALRMWVCSSDYSNDICIGKSIMDKQTEAIKKIRNTLKFLLSNISSTPSTPFISVKSYAMDHYLFLTCQQFLKEMTQYYEQYAFVKAHDHLIQFVYDVSAMYLDIIKDRLYAEHKDSLIRISAQQILYYMIQVLMISMAPIMSHTAEEVYQQLTMNHTKKKSVFLEKKLWNQLLQQEFTNEYTDSSTIPLYLEMKKEINKWIEKGRVEKIWKSSQEITICVENWNHPLLPQHEMEELFMCSSFLTNQQATESPIYTFAFQNSTIYLYKTTQHKCPRCWKYNSKEEDHLCKRCSSI